MPHRHAPEFVMNNPAPKQVYNARIFVIVVIACMGAVIFGYDLAFIGTTITLASFEKDFGLDDATQSTLDDFAANVVSLLQAGCFIGAISGPALGDKWGRKPALSAAGTVFCIGSLIQTLSFGSWAALFIGRLIGGVGVGAASALVPLYVAELSPPDLRGTLVGCYEIFVQTGTCIGFWICYALQQTHPSNRAQWMTPFAVQLVPGGLLLIGMFCVPESPRWQAKSRTREKALAGLARLRNLPQDHPYVIEEFGRIRAEIEGSKCTTSDNKHWKQTFREYRRPDLCRRFGIVIMLFIFMQFAGSNSINYYSVRIFKSTGLGATFLATGIYGLVRLAAVIISMGFLVDRLGRRIMLMVGASVMALSMFYLGSYTKLNPESTQSGPGGYAAVTFVFVFAVGFCLSFAGIPWIYASEIFPAEHRGTGMAVATATHWLLNFTIARSTPYMLSNIKFGTYFLFAACTTISVPFVYFFVPETKGVPLEQIGALFGEISDPHIEPSFADSEKELSVQRLEIAKV